jgi:hypothetical protein
MRKFFLSAFVLAATVALTSSAFALEKTVRKAPEMRDDWGASNTVTVRYYNICTGWAYGWSGFASGQVLGVDVDAGGTNCNLVATSLFYFTGAPSGYGFTGTISVSPDCSSLPLASQPFLPVTTWQTQLWGVNVPSAFTVAWSQGPSAFANPSVVASDHPAVGPTGPQPLGTCYPLNRTTHSFDFGINNAFCGADSTANDGVGNVEWFLSSFVKCPVSVEDASWGQIKNLYR